MSAYQSSVFLWMVLIVYNISTIVLLRAVLSALSFTSMLVEKRDIQESTDTEPTSASRVIAAIGSIILATFLWALGNVVLYKSIVGPGTGIGSLLSEIGNFFLVGASLFAPYAFNQLTDVFRTDSKRNRKDKSTIG